MFFEEYDEGIKAELNSFIRELEANGFLFDYGKQRVDLIYKKYAICSIKYQAVSRTQLSLTINKALGNKYIPLQKKEYFSKYWSDNIERKEYVLREGNKTNGLKDLIRTLLTIKDIFIENIVVDFNIDKINFTNYRCFSDEEFKFNKQLTILLGKNGVGKTSILEGVTVGIGAFLSGIDEYTDTRSIYKSDIRFDIKEVGLVPQRNDFPPTIVKFSSKFINEKIEWSRTKYNLDAGRTSTKDSSIVTNVVRQIVEDIRKDGTREITLPVFSYHGTGRVASFNRDMRLLEKTEKISRFVGYKDCLKPASNYKFFLNWYRKMKFNEFELGIKIPSLTAVTDSIRIALQKLTEGEQFKIKDIRYYDGDIHILDDNNKLIPISYLSDGFQDVIGIVSDIAYRMAILNPHLEEKILSDTPGIVLIDEIEQHLHPKWQQNILGILKIIFPKVQFIVTTHSPVIISSTEENEALELSNSCDGIKYEIVGNPREWYISDILKNIFNIDESIDTVPKGSNIEDKLERFSEVVKRYLVTNDESLRNEATILYLDMKPSIPEGSPRRRVLERLKELIK